MKRSHKFALAIAAISLALFLLMAFRPRPIEVEVAAVQRGPLEEIVEQEGKTRMHDHYVVASPVAGRLSRIDLHSGDAVKAGEVVATIEPLPLDPQQRISFEARLNAARESQKEASARLEHARADAEQARIDLGRSSSLASQGVISRDALEKSQNAAVAAEKELVAAASRAKAAGFQVEEAEAALLAVSGNQPAQAKRVQLHSPVSGRVLRLMEQSERTVNSGTPLLELGYTPRLEIVADFLTTDAVRISPGMPARIWGWGGAPELAAVVRLVEPSAFTKISALGVEEQRVNVILDFLGVPDHLGDGFRVEVQVITWQSPSLLKIPVGALFRRGEDWSVFVAEGNRAYTRAVKIGHRNDREAQVLEGLNENDKVIVYPANELANNKRIQTKNRVL